MGTVYEAIQQSPRRIVALKALTRGLRSAAKIRRFTQEAEILARLHHPFMAQIYEAGSHDHNGHGVPFFTMEYIPTQRSTDHRVCRGERTLHPPAPRSISECPGRRALRPSVRRHSQRSQTGQYSDRRFDRRGATEGHRLRRGAHAADDGVVARHPRAPRSRSQVAGCKDGQDADRSIGRKDVVEERIIESVCFLFFCNRCRWDHEGLAADYTRSRLVHNKKKPRR